ncbi:MAG: NAD(P)-dependent alcohol dehydrogenase [Bifidobacteriaceae bacterium]|jgi:uncharacterized zinc-type alcohol dehydrogenase-like protein|nr:NAD(P)-dependent alcohol dehydrogenase [Bifidobacteriaceae bacterium]
MPTARAYAIDGPTGRFAPTVIQRREPGPTEILIDIKYGGICHSDIHTARGEWGQALYPLVPGHEIAGVVSAVGQSVTKHQIGDQVGVGCYVDSCGTCELCFTEQHQFCNDAIWTYNCLGRDSLPTAGGYSTAITVEQDYALKIPPSLELAAAAPLLCAGITTYAPLKRWGAAPGKRVAVIGLGGLGHMAVQIAAAMGAEVAVISQTQAKQADSLRFGAVEHYALNEPDVLQSLKRSFDMMLCTVGSTVNLDALIGCLKVGGALVDVGLPEHSSTLRLSSLTGGNRILAGSQLAGLAETQEMLEFCAAHKIAAQVEVISGEQINQAYNNVVDSKVRYRYVIDTATL